MYYSYLPYLANQKLNGLFSASHQVSLKPSFCVKTNQPMVKTLAEVTTDKNESMKMTPCFLLSLLLRVGGSDILANHELDVIFACPDLYSSNERLNKHMGVLL